MKYGIIVCPKCKRVKGVLLTSKSTKCINCNKTLTLKKLRMIYKTNSEADLREKIGLVNANIDGNLDNYKSAIKN